MSSIYILLTAGRAQMGADNGIKEAWSKSVPFNSAPIFTFESIVTSSRCVQWSAQRPG